MNRIRLISELWRGTPVWVVFEDNQGRVCDATGTLIDQDPRWVTLRDKNKVLDFPRANILRMEEI